jgi:hypothetical protein
LGLHLTDEQYKQCTVKVKAIADIRKLGLDDIDALIHEFHGELAKTKEVAPPTPASMVPDSREGSVDMLS